MDKPFDYDYVVIGSGFGGAVSALRLSEKGYSVAVLEMGRRYGPDDFPRRNWNVRRYLWLPKLGCRGIQRISLFRDVLIFAGAGVGGGSLVYANTLLEPPAEAFRDPCWPASGDWQEVLRPHYDTARAMLGAADVSETFPADELLRAAVEEVTGTPATLVRHRVGVYTGEAEKEVPDPYFGGQGPTRTGCCHCGECMTGCKKNAKNSVDKNYLYLAELRGCRILAETRVTDIRPLAGGGYEVVADAARGRRQVLRSRGVVVAGGVLGTLQLLLRCRERGSLQRLSGRLGCVVRTNSEALLAVMANGYDVDYSRGLAITSGVYPDPDTHIEIVRYGKGHGFMSLLATILTGGGAPWPRWLRWLGNIVRHPLRFARTASKWRWAERTSVVLVMQTRSSHLRFRLARSGRLASVREEGQQVPTYLPLANAVTRRLAEKVEGVPCSILFEVLLDTSSTAHILGGAIMGDSPDQGVCDRAGRVFGYEDLYVADGSLVPANLGVNPALTITALAEYVMSHIPTRPEVKEKIHG